MVDHDYLTTIRLVETGFDCVTQEVGPIKSGNDNCDIWFRTNCVFSSFGCLAKADVGLFMLPPQRHQRHSAELVRNTMRPGHAIGSSRIGRFSTPHLLGSGRFLGTALIVGVTGQPAAYLARKLLNSGVRVVGTSRDYNEANRWRLWRLGVIDYIEHVSLSVHSTVAIRKALNTFNPDQT